MNFRGYDYFFNTFRKMQMLLKDAEISKIFSQVLTFEFCSVVFDMELHEMHIYYL